MKKNLEIKEIIEKLKEKSCDYAEYLCDYDGNSYICDAFSEIADNNISTFYCDIINYLKNHVDEVNDIINEYSWNGVNRDIYKATQYAQCNDIFSQLNNDLHNAIKLYALNFLQKNNIAKITEEQYNILVEELGSIDNNSYIEEITDVTRDVFNIATEEE
jgi:hypothetical protein